MLHNTFSLVFKFYKVALQRKKQKFLITSAFGWGSKLFLKLPSSSVYIRDMILFGTEEKFIGCKTVVLFYTHRWQQSVTDRGSQPCSYHER